MCHNFTVKRNLNALLKDKLVGETCITRMGGKTEAVFFSKVETFQLRTHKCFLHKWLRVPH